MRLRLFVALAVGAGGFALAADLPPEQVQFFEQKIRPVLVEHCYECHSAQAKKLKAGLHLDSRAGWQRGGDSGEPAIVPGQPDASQLIQAVRHEDADTAMPPKKPKLPDAVIADFVAWVKMGAPDPRDGPLEAKRADKATWWSLQPLAHAEPPMPRDLPETWAQNPIDRFVFAKLAEKNLAPSEPADPRTLIRRITYDLTGLPPTSEEVQAFVDESHRSNKSYKTYKTYEQLIDKLLASPHYGEQ